MKSIPRRSTKSKINSTQRVKNEDNFHADPSWCGAIEDRLKNLEEESSESSRWFAGFCECRPDMISLSERDVRISFREPKRISDAELLFRRDALIRFLEKNWPELESLCGPLPDLEALKRILEEFARGSRDRIQGMIDDHRLAAVRLLKYFSGLESFLKKHQQRFAEDPRQIANAMAGYPDMGFWWSLKRCQQSPCQDVIDPRAMKAYMRRKHPELYEMLSKQPSLSELEVFWTNYRTKDETMKGLRAVDLKRFWEAGRERANIA